MTAKLILSPLAESDIVEIGAFIASDNPTRAVSFVRELRTFLDTITSTPGIGRVRHDLIGSPHSVVFRRYPYVVFYEPLDTDDGIRVLRVLHGARDHARILDPH